MKKLLFIFVFFFVLYFSGRVLLVWNAPNSDSEDRADITVRLGMSVKSIAHLLEEHDVIKDALMFQWYARYYGLASSLQAGDYTIQKNLTFAEVVEVLQSAKSEETSVTIPEGSTVQQIDDILAKKSLIEPGDFVRCTTSCDLGFRISSLEGYLFPDTYKVNPKNFSSKEFIQKLHGTFQSRIEPIRPDIQASGRTLEEIVIMASMIEREAAHDEEMPLIADVLWKRYDEGIALGVDATTRYELNDWKRPLYTEDFETKSPYNTRRQAGLPPTAISNPGLPALKSAVYPESNPYYYYLHDANGQIHFAEDHDGHIENKRKYLD